MTTYNPPKKNTAFVFHLSLISQANTKVMQANPTLAAGDFKIAIDDGAPANFATLPVVDADFTKRVKVELSAAEMNGDNITLICSDAAGAEWCDLVINLQTVARQIDDLAYPTVSGRSLDVTATGAAGIDWANVENPTTAVNLSGTNIDVDQVVASVSGAVGSVSGAVTVGTNNDKTGYSLTTAPLDAAGIRTAVGLATSNLDTQLDALPTAAENATQVRTELATELGRIDAAVSTRATPAQVNNEVVDALAVDTYAEPGQGTPAATASLTVKINYLYKAWRNKKTQTSSTFSLFADDATTVDQKATVSDDSTTTTVGEIATGP
jgi:hypothetical protein